MATPILPLALEGTRLADGSVNAGGSIYCYEAGTLTQADVYADADAESTLSQPITLGAYGQVTVYADAVIDLAVYNEAGSLLYTIERANAVHSGTVDVESAGFTGVNTAGQTVASGRGSLEALETKAYTSFNGTDFKYLAASSATERAMYSVLRERGLSVKDFGAAGDGLTIDTVAFTSAISVLKAAGGGCLIIPPGTYLLDAALTIDFSGLFVLGYGINVSIIKSTSLTANIFTISGAYNFDCENLQLTATSTSTGYGIDSVGQGCSFRKIKTNNLAAGINLGAGSFDVEISHCNIQATSSTTNCIRLTGNLCQAIRILCNYLEGTTAGGNGIAIEVTGANTVNDILIFGNRFGTIATGIKIGSTVTGTDFRLVGNYLALSATPVNIGPTGNANVRFSQSTNNFGANALTDASSVTVTDGATLTLTGSQDFYVVPGTTACTRISTIGYSRGSRVTLQFSGACTMTHGTAASGANAGLKLSGAGNFSADADDTLTIVWDGTWWREVARTVI